LISPNSTVPTRLSPINSVDVSFPGKARHIKTPFLVSRFSFGALYRS
jgi:hypothetical protein